MDSVGILRGIALRTDGCVAIRGNSAACDKCYPVNSHAASQKDVFGGVAGFGGCRSEKNEKYPARGTDVSAIQRVPPLA